MKRFVVKILIFYIPVVLLLAPPVLTLYTSGENFKNIDNLIVNGSKYLIGYSYNESNYGYLKWERIVTHPKSTVLVLGSSRVLQFRKEMFNVTFYNAGYTVSSIKDLVPFLQSLPKEKYPSYLIVGLDQWMFNKEWDDLSGVIPIGKWSSSFSTKPNFSEFTNIWHDLLTKKVRMIYYNNVDDNVIRVGLMSYVNNRGFRNDGSMDYGNQIEKLLKNDNSAFDFEYKDTYNRIEEGIRMFQYGETVNNSALNELDNFLKFCISNDIYVIGFLPPFADKVNERFKISGNYHYMDQIYLQAIEYFKKYDFELYDFTYLNHFGSFDLETVDGFHGGELTYSKLLIKMIENDSKLKLVSNLQKIKGDLVTPINRYIIYKY